MSYKKDEFNDSEMIYNIDNEMSNCKEIGLFKMIYKLKENKAHKEEKIKTFKEYFGSLFKDEKKDSEDSLRILGKYFVNRNKNKSKLIYNNKKYELKELFKDIDNNYADKDIIKLKIIGINFITDMSRIFNGCFYLSEVSEIQECKINDLNNGLNENNLNKESKLNESNKSNNNNSEERNGKSNRNNLSSLSYSSI